MMTTDQINAISAALREHQEAMNAANVALMSKIKAVPGGEEMLRRNLVERGLCSPQIAALLAGEVPADAVDGLLGLNTNGFPA